MVIGVGILSTHGAAQSQGDRPEFVGNQVLVQFRGDAGPAARAAARARVKGVLEDVVVAADRRNDGKGDLELVRIPLGLAVAAAARDLAEDSAVEFAEPNWVYRHQAVPNDPYFGNGSLWGMYGDAVGTPTNAFGSQAEEAWAANNIGNSSVHIGVIDEGVMRTHQDLSGNMWVNPGEVANNGIDDDGNGFVDDVHGWDFNANNNSIYDGPQDDHGTHVAGTIGAVGDNNKGVVGMNWDVTLIPVKFLGPSGGTTANAIKAIDYLIDLKSRYSLNLVATNNSWGGGGVSTSLLAAINRGGDAGILFVAAAGNGGADGVGDDNDLTPFYPSNYECTNGGTRGWDCVIAVAAIRNDGAKATFSNFGATTVDLGAPGQGIYSTVPSNGKKAAYASYSGTSMATPHVAGAAALYAASHSGATPLEIKNAILAAAQNTFTASLNGKAATNGRLNVSGF